MLLKLYLNLENILDLVCVREGLFSVLVDVVLLLIISPTEEIGRASCRERVFALV